ncbi:MAG TPA: PDZ domain-containing protein, partial [Ramlibacter sp.]|nr:PDZ domain-containing protein [Ramlibacter sp.]
KPVLAEMQQTGSTRVSRRPWLGLSSTEQGGRVQIVRVNRESPASDAGLVPGDVVLAIDGEKVSTLEAFYKRLWARADPEGEVQLTVQQGAQVRQLTLRAVDRMKTMRRPAGI